MTETLSRAERLRQIEQWLHFFHREALRAGPLRSESTHLYLDGNLISTSQRSGFPNCTEKDRVLY